MKKIGKRRTGGRNEAGRITVRHRGGGHKRYLRILEKDTTAGIYTRTEYDPNRTGRLAVVRLEGNKYGYKLLGGEIGGEIKAIRLKNVQVGQEIYKVGGGVARAAGTACKVIKQTEGETFVRLPSGVIQSFNNDNTCFLGRVWTDLPQNHEKAGYSRRKGIRPTVKGVSMNPIDHPNGGKTKGGQPKTRWGKLAKWQPTRSTRKPSLKI